MTQTEELLALAEKYSRIHGLALATISSRIMGDGGLFQRLADGGDCTTKTYRRCVDFFKDAGLEINETNEYTFNS